MLKDGRGVADEPERGLREHFVPLLVAIGAADDGERVQFPISGFWLSSLTRRSVQFG
jgi:aromatic ring-opening dioxygenase catalytic subunit (LigB family)